MKLHHRIGKFLCYAVAIYGAFLAFWALRDLYKYWQLDSQTTGEVQESYFQELSASRYEIFASYTYIYGARPYKGVSSLGKPYQLNKYAAEKAVEDLKHSKPVIYLNNKHPEISSLIKKFPTLAVLNAVLTLGIALYLWILNLWYAPRR